MIDIQVISLPESHQRRESVQKQLGGLGLDFSFFDAIDGRSNDPNLISLNPVSFLIRNNRYPVPGEVGCYTSHRMLWQRCLEENKPIVIMEDDFTLSDRAETVFHYAEKLSCYFSFLKFEEAKKHKVVKAEGVISDVEILSYKRAPNILMAYMITPRAAKKMLYGKEMFFYPVDEYVRNSWLHGVKIRGIDPPLVEFSGLPISQESTIGERKAECPWWAKCQQTYFKSRNSIMTHLHYYKND
jgi:glycosyl transferase family 25